MKKLLLLLLTFSLVLSSFALSPVAAADDDNSDKAIEVAVALGLMNGAFAADPGAEMTRGDLIEVVLRLCGVTSAGGAPVFTDLDETHVHYNSIMTAYNMGIVSGFGDGTVRPDDPAQVSHAMKLIYYALGYKEFIEETNNPAMAVSRAKVGKNGDINSTAILTAGKLATLMVEAGESYPLDVQAITRADGGASYEYYNADQTALERYYKISKIEGIVTCAGGMNLESGTRYDSDRIVIDGMVLKKDRVNAVYC